MHTLTYVCIFLYPNTIIYAAFFFLKQKIYKWFYIWVNTYLKKKICDYCVVYDLIINYIVVWALKVQK